MSVLGASEDSEGLGGRWAGGCQGLLRTSGGLPRTCVWSGGRGWSRDVIGGVHLEFGVGRGTRIRWDLGVRTVRSNVSGEGPTRERGIAVAPETGAPSFP